MVKICIMCRKVYSQVENRSLHGLPKDEKWRRKWLDALEIDETKITKNIWVCSDHFAENSFVDTVFNARKSLIKGAVPFKTRPPETLLPTVGLPDVEVKPTSPSYPAPDSPMIPNLEQYLELGLHEVDADGNGDINCQCKKNGNINNRVDICGCDEGRSSPTAFQLNSVHFVSMAEALENQSANKKKNIRNMQWKNPDYNFSSTDSGMFRELFVSDEAYETFLGYVSGQQKLVDNLVNQLNGRKRKIQHLQQVIEKMRKERDEDE